MNSREALEILYKNCPMVVTRESDGVQLYSEYLTEVIKQDLDRLGQFEKELGISLLILFKAIKNGIIAESVDGKDELDGWRLSISFEQKCFVLQNFWGKFRIDFKDYGKSWYLKEDLKSE